MGRPHEGCPSLWYDCSRCRSWNESIEPVVHCEVWSDSRPKLASFGRVNQCAVRSSQQDGDRTELARLVF
jgi:hypothetical protein